MSARKADLAREPAEKFAPAPVPESRSLPKLRSAAAGCRACPLWRNATCTVFGEGPARAKLLFVGEQPGDQEDLAGKPFIGPAGKLLDRAMLAAGIARKAAFVTNAVKHFKWMPQGKRRLHAKPSPREIAACRPWLISEIEAVRPSLIICLGSSAARQVLGKAIKVTAQRGQKVPTEFNIPALITVHPSSLLRSFPGADREAEFERFVGDLRRCVK